MDEETEPKRTRSQFGKDVKLVSPEVEEQIVNLRMDGKTWTGISDIVAKETGDRKINRTTVKNIYNRALSKTITTEKKAGKKFADYTEELNKMYGKAIRTLSRWINAADGLSTQLEDAIDEGKVEAIKAYGILLKTAPQMKAISSEIRDYMKFQIDQQDKIKTEQTALVWDESQMLDYMDRYLNKLEREGKIRWIKPRI